VRGSNYIIKEIRRGKLSLAYLGNKGGLIRIYGRVLDWGQAPILLCKEVQEDSDEET